jgi:hypothetical protein
VRYKQSYIDFDNRTITSAIVPPVALDDTSGVIVVQEDGRVILPRDTRNMANTRPFCLIRMPVSTDKPIETEYRYLNHKHYATSFKIEDGLYFDYLEGMLQDENDGWLYAAEYHPLFNVDMLEGLINGARNLYTSVRPLINKIDKIKSSIDNEI